MSSARSRRGRRGVAPDSAAACSGSGKGGDGRTGSVGFSPQADAPSCSDCGSIMIRNGILLQMLELRRDQRVLVSER